MSDFASNLRRLRKAGNFTLDDLAGALNVKFGTAYHKGTLSKWEHGSDPSMDSVRNVAAFFGVTLDELLGVDQGTVSVIDRYLPILGAVAAGLPLYAEQNILGYTPCPSFIKGKDRDLFYLRVRGDSMNREFPDGADVLVDQEAHVKSGDIAVILVHGEDGTVKKVKLEDDKIVLIPMSDNPDHYAQAYFYNETEVKIIGKVIGVFKTY